MSRSIGCLHVHACPASLRAAADSVVASALADQPPLCWTPLDDTLSASSTWQGGPGSAAAIADGLRRLGAITFEVTEDPSPGVDGERFCFVPDLGFFHAATNAIGDVVVDENQLAAAIREAPNAEALRARLARLIGRPWDDALEPLRMRAWPSTRVAATG